jgi:hypothetical protein
VFPDWLHFGNCDGEVQISVNAVATTLMKSAGLFIVLRIANVDARGEWFVQGLPQLFRDVQATDKFLQHRSACRWWSQGESNPRPLECHFQCHRVFDVP